MLIYNLCMAQNDDNSNDILEKTSIVASDTFKGRLREADDAPPALLILIGPPGYVGSSIQLQRMILSLAVLLKAKSILMIKLKSFSC